MSCDFLIAKVATLVFDLGNILDAILPPQLSEKSKHFGGALDEFQAILAQSFEFDKFTHGFGPGVVLVTILKLKQFLGAENLNQGLVSLKSELKSKEYEESIGPLKLKIQPRPEIPITEEDQEEMKRWERDTQKRKRKANKHSSDEEDNKRKLVDKNRQR